MYNLKRIWVPNSYFSWELRRQSRTTKVDSPHTITNANQLEEDKWGSVKSVNYGLYSKKCHFVAQEDN